MRLLRALLCVLAVLPHPARAAEQAPPGRIVFVSSRTADGNADIFSADLGGEQVVNLTENPAPDRSPTWSPDGNRIAWEDYRSQSAYHSIRRQQWTPECYPGCS